MAKETDDREYKYAELPLSGRWRPALDGTELEKGDFQTLTNMRYGEKTPRSVTGMTKINSETIHATNIKTRSGFHFRKDQPAETHVLVQAVASGTRGSVYQNTTAIPNTGQFLHDSNEQLWDDSTGSQVGKFSDAPDGCVVYTNGIDSCVWGGTEYRCASFLLKSTTVAASVILTGTDDFHDADTVTLGSKTYTFKDTVGTTEGNVHIGGTLATSLDNLMNAVLHLGTPNTDYYCAAAHTTVTATTNTATQQTFVALTAGTSGNSIASTQVSTHATFASATLLGGLDEGASYLYDYTDQVNNTLTTSVATLNQSPSYVYIASTRPIKGAKFYIGTANTGVASVAVNYWASSAWNAVGNLDDQSDVTATKTLSGISGTGYWINFDTTVSTAKPKSINRVYAYWYQFVFTGIDATTTVYYVTVDAPFQAIVDLWDGSARSPTSYLRYVSSAYIDESIQVLEEDYLSGDVLTYSDTSSLATASRIYVGFVERMTGLDITLVTGKVNSTASVLTVKYWNGSTWTTVGTIDDGTKTTSTTFSKSGPVLWDAPTESSEFKNAISNSDLWYYYELSVGTQLSANVYIDKVTGIPAQQSIKGYRFPVMWQDRIWLLDEYQGDRNKAICSSDSTVCVFNGMDSTELTFGKLTPLKGGATLFTRFGGDLYNNLVILKQDEVWLVDGAGPGYYSKYKIAGSYGLTATGTLKTCDMGYEIAPGLLKHVLIWQSDGAVVLFDGSTISPVSQDIDNYFDPAKTECIRSSYADISEAFYDEKKHEYHWLFVSGTSDTTLNTELVYDLLKKKWFKIDRGTGNYLQLGISVQDTDGNAYTYGTLDTGYVERLEYGTHFDNTDITSTMRIGDIPFGGWNYLTQIRSIKHIAVAKATTTDSVTITHYGDCITTSGSTTVTTGLKSTTHRVIKANKSVNWGDYIFHSLNFSFTTDDEDVSYEPIGLAVRFKITKEDVI